MEKAGQRVCVTGSSGYIGGWVTKSFLEDGHYSVRGTVRDPNNSAKVAGLKEALGEASSNLELVAADLLDQESLNKAFEDIDYVIHVASPLLAAEPKDENEVLGPAVSGTENVINACFQNKVKRVVITSTALAIINWHKEEEEVDEDSWAEITKDTPLYDKSKILAEKKAWEMIENQPPGNKLELVVLNPALVTGKALFKSEFTSAMLGMGLMTGKIPKCPVVHVPYVDVQDVARAHVLAVTAPPGERYALLEGTHKIVEIGRAFSKEFKHYGYKCTDKEMSYCLAKTLSCCVSDLRRFIRLWNKRRPIRNDKALKKLGMGKFKELDESISEMGWSFIELGMVPDKTKPK